MQKKAVRWKQSNLFWHIIKFFGMRVWTYKTQYFEHQRTFSCNIYLSPSEEINKSGFLVLSQARAQCGLKQLRQASLRECIEPAIPFVRVKIAVNQDRVATHREVPHPQK